MKKPTGKIVHRNSVVGQQGINLIATIVTDMGYLWTGTTGFSDAGIDGYLEIRNPQTGEATNLILQVQSKATTNPWESETATTFVYRCDERDLNYWLQGNAPVILVVSRPSTKEAYWVSVKDHFASLEARKSRKVQFDKQKNFFSTQAASALASLAVRRDSGIYLGPPPKSEVLFTNLVPVARYAQKLFIASTNHRKPEEIWRTFKEKGVRTGGEWFLSDGRIFSFQDLSAEHWKPICDAGTLEEFHTDEWAHANDHQRKNEFVRLLGLTLREFLGAKGVWLFKPKNGFSRYYFAPTKDLSPRVVRWKKIKESERTVFQAYPSKKDPSRIAYHRHLAFEPRFRRFGGTWFLEVTPTYHFTSDGKMPSRFAESYLSGIKRIEKHVAVGGNVHFWANFLAAPRDLFAKGSDFISFAGVLEFPVDFGIRDEDWLSKAEADEKEMLLDLNDTDLFSENES